MIDSDARFAVRNVEVEGRMKDLRQQKLFVEHHEREANEVGGRVNTFKNSLCDISLDVQGDSDEDLWDGMRGIVKRTVGSMFGKTASGTSDDDDEKGDVIRAPRPSSSRDNIMDSSSPEDSADSDANPSLPLGERFVAVTKHPRERLRKAMLEFYRYLELLKNFRILNETAQTKILKVRRGDNRDSRRW